MPVKIDGINVHTDYKHISQVQHLGCSWVRIDINWWQIELAKNNYVWSPIDSLVNTYASKGIKIYATLMGTPKWHKPNFTNPPDPYIWQNFCTAFAKRYNGKIAVISLWNEPNLGKRFWTGSTKDFFEIIIKHGYEAVKTVNPNVSVACGDFATTSSSDWPEWLSMAKKYKKYFDIIGIHTYHDTVSEVKRCWNLGKVPIIGWFLPKWQPYSWYLSGIHKPVYLTETGLVAAYGNNKEMAKQKKFAEEIMKDKKDIDVENIFFYCLTDANPAAEQPYGFYDSSFRPKLVAQ